MKHLQRICAAAAAAALAAGLAGAQDRVVEAPGAGARDEMIEIFQRVEKRLQEIDALLYDASAGESGLEPLAESGIGELLKASQQKGQEVLSGIDRLLELAQQQRGQPQGGGQSQQPGEQQGGSPLDQQPGGPTQREQTPQAPSEGEQQDQQGQQGQPQQEQQQGQPDGPRQSEAPARNQEGGAPPGSATGGPQPQDGNERWGDLPIHVRDLFRAEGGGDMPPQYRDWIDSYYRRLNQRP